jgi:DNA-binding IclR family transcriptional regulator
MIQVLHRAFDILELLAGQSSVPLPLGQIAQQTQLHPATCANILRTLMTRGYVQQSSRRQGYTLGPMAWRLGQAAVSCESLVGTAQPILAELAGRVQETVLLAVLQQDRRLTLLEIEGKQDLQVRAEAVASDDVYQTVTGRLLLAYLAPGQLETFIARCGLPGPRWPGIESKEDLLIALAKIQRRGQIVDVPKPQIAAAAFAVHCRESVVAAIGVFLPKLRFKGQHKDTLLEQMETVAREISKQLSNTADGLDIGTIGKMESSCRR